MKLMKLRTLLAAALLSGAAGLLPAAACAGERSEPSAPGSIWGRENLLADRTFKTHDLVTIVIREKSKTSTKLETDYAKSNSLGLDIAKAFSIKGTGDGGLTYEPLTTGSKKPELDLKFDSKREGSGEVKSQDTFEARVTAEVIEVLPNGQLVLEARKRLTTGEATVTLALTGRIRPEDVSSDNTVDSDRVADPRIEYNPSGSVADANRRGWLARIWDFVNVF